VLGVCLCVCGSKSPKPLLINNCSASTEVQQGRSKAGRRQKRRPQRFLPRNLRLTWALFFPHLLPFFKVALLLSHHPPHHPTALASPYRSLSVSSIGVFVISYKGSLLITRDAASRDRIPHIQSEEFFFPYASLPTTTLSSQDRLSTNAVDCLSLFVPFY